MRRRIALFAALFATSASASTLSAPEHKVGLRLVLSADGKIGSCAVATPSDQPGSDRAICDAMVANGFVRSTDPIPSANVLTTLRWTGDGTRLDRSYQPDDRTLLLRPSDGQPWLAIQDYPDEILAGQPGRIVVDYSVAPSGRVQDCHAKDAKAVPALAEWTCRILTDRRVLPRRLDGRGKPRPYASASLFLWAPTGVQVCDTGDACFRDR